MNLIPPPQVAIHFAMLALVLVPASFPGRSRK